MYNLRLAVLFSCFSVLLVSPASMSDAETYQLQVASVPEPVFMYFVKGWTLPGIDAFLEGPRSKFVSFLDRQPRPLELTLVGHSESYPADVALPKLDDPWGVMEWTKTSGSLAVFVVRGRQRAYQRLKRVAIHTDGVLSRFPVRRIPVSQRRPMPVPAVPDSYLTHALENGTFAAWSDRRAVSVDGLSVIVGRHHNVQQTDTVYIVVRMADGRKDFKVVLGWENIEGNGDHAKSQGTRN